MSKLSKYIAWNEALVDYFVRNGSTVWYVTENIIEHIGEQYEIKKDCEEELYTDDFVKSCFSFSQDYYRWFQCPDNANVSYLEDENEGCTEENVTQFDEENISIQDVYAAFRNGKISDVRSKVEICDIQFNQIVDVCVIEYEENLLFRPLYCLTQTNNRFYLRREQLPNADSSLFDFALFLGKHTLYYDDNGVRKQFYYPYFSYLILVLLGFGRSNQQTWDEVERLFYANGVKLPIDERRKIAQLFKKAIHDGLLNEHCIRTPDCYIKYLKYHSVLTPGRRNAFENVLYDHNISFGEGMHFNDIRNWIWRASSQTELNQFREALQNNENRHYFETVIRSFDRETYRKMLNERNANHENHERAKGVFRFVVNTEKQGVSVWVEQIKVIKDLQNDDLHITSHEILPGNFIVKTPEFNWNNYVENGLRYVDENYLVRSSAGKSCYYFEIVNNKWLVEVTEPDRLVGQPCFFATRNQNDSLLQRHKNTREDTRPITRFFLPEGWHLFYTDSYVLEAVGDQDVANLLNNPIASARVVTNDAIRVAVDGKQCYLAEAFPYITFEGIEYANVRINGYDSRDNHPIHFKQKQVKDRIYLYDFGKVQSGVIIIKIFDDRNNSRIDDDTDAKSRFQIRKATEVCRCDNKEYVKFDKWFCQTDSDDSYYSNNRVYPLQQKNSAWEATTDLPICNEGRYENFMAVIYALGETKQHGMRKAIKDADLEKAITYEADFRGVTLSPAEIKRLKYALCDLGVLTHFYDNGHYYQTNSACLIPTGVRYVEDALNDGAGGVRFYILGGAYSKTEYNMAIAGARYVEYVEQQDSLFSLIPRMVKVGYEAGVNLPLPENNYCTYDKLLAFAGEINDFDQIAENNMEGANDPNAPDTPCMEPTGYVRGRTERLRLNRECILSNSDIFPRSLLRNYVNYKHNKPAWVQRSNGDIYVKDEFDIPYYAKRALESFSGCVAQSVYVFDVDNVVFAEQNNGNQDKHLFERLITYPSPTGRMRNDFIGMLRNVLGGDAPRVDKVRVPNDDNRTIDLSLYAYYKIEMGTKKWWMELSYKGNVVCYTDPESRNAFCLCGGIYKKMIGNERPKQKLSKVIKLYDEMYNQVPENYYTDYHITLEVNVHSQCFPSYTIQDKEKFEVIIMRSL